jgi:hypothetical protein
MFCNYSSSDGGGGSGDGVLFRTVRMHSGGRISKGVVGKVPEGKRLGCIPSGFGWETRSAGRFGVDGVEDGLAAGGLAA